MVRVYSQLWLATKDAAWTHIPVCFRSSTQAQSQGFPLSAWRKRGYNITSFKHWEIPVRVTGGGTAVIHSLRYFLIQVSLEVDQMDAGRTFHIWLLVADWFPVAAALCSRCVPVYMRVFWQNLRAFLLNLRPVIKTDETAS